MTHLDERMGTRVVTAHLPTELAEKLDDLAERLGCSKGWLVNEAVASFFALAKERYGPTLEALADVDRRCTIGHAEIEAWAAGLGKSKRSRRR